jgi:hypothetical protein
MSGQAARNSPAMADGGDDRRRGLTDPLSVMPPCVLRRGNPPAFSILASGGRPIGYPRPGQSWPLLAKAPAAEQLNVGSVKSFGHVGEHGLGGVSCVSNYVSRVTE